MKGKFLYIYYALLLVVLCSWTSTTSSPSMPLRLAYLAAAVLPAALKKNWVPIVFTCLMTVATQGFAYSYFPSGVNYFGYCALLTIIVIAVSGKDSSSRYVPSIVYILLIYVTMVDLVTSASIQQFSYMALMIVCLLINTDVEDGNVRLSWSTAFSLATVVLSLAFLINREMFSMAYEDSSIDRIGWTDPNYFGMVLGMGTITSLNELFSKDSKLLMIYKIIFIVAIALSLPVLFLNASRGAILAIAIGVIITVLFTKIKSFYKIVIFGVFAIFIWFLYTNSYLELLIYRVNNLQGGDTTNGRVSIWVDKLMAFFNECSVLNWLFGVGYDDAINVGPHIRFHNDFVAFIVEYGILGFALFLSMLLAPFKIFLMYNKKNIAFISSFFYLIFCLFSLEPFTLGSVSFFFFYAYLICLARQEKKTYSNNDIPFI